MRLIQKIDGGGVTIKHFSLIGLKILLLLVVLFIILGIGYGVSFGNVLFISIVLGISAYLIGDLLILSRTNNTIATVADFGIAFVIIYLMTDGLTVGGNPFAAALVSAVVVAIAEVIFHKYVAKRLDMNSDTFIPINRTNYITETSDELTPYKDEEE